jgi:hypothetical protein
LFSGWLVFSSLLFFALCHQQLPLPLNLGGVRNSVSAPVFVNGRVQDILTACSRERLDRPSTASACSPGLPRSLLFASDNAKRRTRP